MITKMYNGLYYQYVQVAGNPTVAQLGSHYSKYIHTQQLLNQVLTILSMFDQSFHTIHVNCSKSRVDIRKTIVLAFMNKFDNMDVLCLKQVNLFIQLILIYCCDCLVFYFIKNIVTTMVKTQCIFKDSKGQDNDDSRTFDSREIMQLDQHNKLSGSWMIANCYLPMMVLMKLLQVAW